MAASQESLCSRLFGRNAVLKIGVQWSECNRSIQNSVALFIEIRPVEPVKVPIEEGGFVFCWYTLVGEVCASGQRMRLNRRRIGRWPCRSKKQSGRTEGVLALTPPPSSIGRECECDPEVKPGTERESRIGSSAPRGADCRGGSVLADHKGSRAAVARGRVHCFGW